MSVMTQPAASAAALAERIFQASIATMDIASIYLGDRLGLYAALAELGDATPGELASRAGANERYVREWLEHQATSALLEVDDAGAAPAVRRYRIPAGHDEVMLDRDSLNFMAPLARLTVGVLAPLPALLRAYREGGGVPYPDFGADTREGIAHLNRAMFVNQLASEWVPAVPGLDARLRAEPGARVADLACGTGWSSIAIARAYPLATVDGFDVDPASIEEARANVAAEGLADRVRFYVQDAADPALAGRYDLVTVFEAVHDMAQPVQALASIRRMLADGGTALVADERVAERFAAPGDEIERFNYGWSILHCLAVGMADSPSAETGTCMRPHTLRGYALDAGFADVEVLPIEHDFWRFYRLVP
jgi:SAM-dependent methyltransferase